MAKNFRIGSVVWKQSLAGRIGMIHNEAFSLMRNPKQSGFEWHMTRRSTGEQWSGASLRVLIEQVWIDLHNETFESDAMPPDTLETCTDCSPAIRAAKGENHA